MIKNIIFTLIVLVSCSSKATTAISGATPVKLTSFPYCDTGGNCKVIGELENKTPFTVQAKSIYFKGNGVKLDALRLFNADDYNRLEIKKGDVMKSQLFSKYMIKNRNYDAETITLEAYERKSFILDLFTNGIMNGYENVILKKDESYRLFFYINNIHFYINDTYIGQSIVSSSPTFFGIPTEIKGLNK